MNLSPLFASLSERFFEGPFCKSPSKRCLGNSHITSPLRKGFCFAHERDTHGVASIAVLGLRRGPHAIIFRIMAVVVDALQRRAARSFSHIFKKRFDALAPALTDLDASAAIRVESASRWVFAPLFHQVPNVVFASAAQAMLQILSFHSETVA